MSHVPEMSEGLRRQRRNVLLLSGVLWFMKYGGLTVTKARLLGIELELQEPSAIYVALWVAWAYFLVRYYQYFRQEAVMALMMNLNHCRTNYCMPVVRQIVAENYGTGKHRPPIRSSQNGTGVPQPRPRDQVEENLQGFRS